MIFTPVPARGHSLLSAHVNGLTFTYSRHHEPVDRHAHRETMIVLGARGLFEERYTGRIATATCDVGTALVRPAGEPHSNRFAQGGARDVAVEVDAAAVRRLAPWSGVLASVRQWRNPQMSVLAHQIHAELAMADSATPLALEALTLELLAVLYRTATPDAGAPRWIRRVRDFVQDEYRSRSIGLRDLADLVGVHPVHLARVYRNAFGETPAESIRRLRVTWAAEHLVRSEKTLSEVALESGFADQSHFTRAFHAAFGTTPGAWRRLQRRSDADASARTITSTR